MNTATKSKATGMELVWETIQRNRKTIQNAASLRSKTGGKSTNTVLKSILARHKAEEAKMTELTAGEKTLHREATDAIAATQMALDSYMDAGTLLRAASKGDKDAAEIIHLRMANSNEFADKLILAVADVPALRNEHTKGLLRLANKRMGNPAHGIELETPAIGYIRLNAGAPCNVSAATTTKLHERYERHQTFFIINHRVVVEGAPNPFACDEHWLKSKQGEAGTKTRRHGHKTYQKRFNENYEGYLRAQDHQSPIGKDLDEMARHLIAGDSVTVVSHAVTDHAKVVAYELARRAERGVREPYMAKPEPSASHHNAAYGSMVWQDDDTDTSMFVKQPELDWTHWYWIPAKEGRHTIAYLLADDRTFLWQDGAEWRMTELGNWTNNIVGPRFLPKVFRHRLWEKKEQVKRTVIDSATGDLVGIENDEHRHAILPWNEQHAPLWLHRKLVTRFTPGIHSYWLKHPSQAVWRLDWEGKAEVIAKAEEFKGKTARTPINYGLGVERKEEAYQEYRGTLEMYIPFNRRTTINAPVTEKSQTMTGLPSQAPSEWQLRNGATSSAKAGERAWFEAERTMKRKTIYHEDDESDAVERGRLEAHDFSLREWAEAEMTDAVFAIEGDGSGNSVGWLRDGDIDAHLAAILGRDQGVYVAGMGYKAGGNNDETVPVTYKTHRQRWAGSTEQEIDRILGKNAAERAAKELSQQEAEAALLLLAIKEGRLTNRDVADIAHRKGYRDCKRTQKDGTVLMWAAASQLLRRSPIYVATNGQPLTDEQSLKLNGRRRFVHYPVRDLEPEAQPRTTDYAQRLEQFHTQTRRNFYATLGKQFVFGVLCLLHTKRFQNFLQAVADYEEQSEPQAFTMLPTQSITADLNASLDAIADAIEAAWTPAAPNKTSPLAPLPAGRAAVTSLGQYIAPHQSFDTWMQATLKQPVA